MLQDCSSVLVFFEDVKSKNKSGVLIVFTREYLIISSLDLISFLMFFILSDISLFYSSLFFKFNFKIKYLKILNLYGIVYHYLKIIFIFKLLILVTNKKISGFK